MHWTDDQVWTIGISYVDPKVWGQGGFAIHLGHWVLCFWREDQTDA